MGLQSGSTHTSREAALSLYMAVKCTVQPPPLSLLAINSSYAVVFRKLSIFSGGNP